MVIAVIDSGINGAIFESCEIYQYRIQAGQVWKESVEDMAGHGTSMLGIILRKQIEHDIILSLRPVICDGTIDNEDIAAAIKFAVDKGAAVISVSMGTDSLKKRACIEEACEFAYENGVAVVCAFSKRGDVILPWACKYVIKVMHGDAKEQPVQFKKTFFDSYMVCVNMPMYRTIDAVGVGKMVVGHSAATAYVAGRIIHYMKKHLCGSIRALQFFLSEYGILYDKEQVCNKVETIKGRISYLDKKDNINWGAAAVIPYSKEMESLVKFQEFGSYDVRVAVDYGKKGIRKEMPQADELPIETSLERLQRYGIDTIIIGYLDKLESYSYEWSMDYILQFALQHNYNVFSFSPIPTNMKKRFEEKCLMIQETKVYDMNYLRQVNQVIPYPLFCKLPVLGVFGTSSKQGKFTLQMLIRKELQKRNIQHISLLTEHQADLLGASICCPMGYGGEANIQINMEAQIEVIQKSLYYLEQTTDAEMILTGGQSWLIPHDIDRQAAIYNLAFLEAVRPDFSVVVVNPEVDCLEYIHDTINTLKSVYKTKTIAIAFSDKETVLRGKVVLRKPRGIQNMKETAYYLREKTGIYAACITEGDFVKNIVDGFIKLTS